MDDDRKWAVDLSKLSILVPKVTIDTKGIDFGWSGLRRSLDRLRETEELSHRELVSIPQSGRPKGRTETTADLVEELARRVMAGENPTRAAIEMFKQRGVKSGLKNKADHLVRVLKTQRF